MLDELEGILDWFRYVSDGVPGVNGGGVSDDERLKLGFRGSMKGGRGGSLCIRDGRGDLLRRSCSRSCSEGIEE